MYTPAHFKPADHEASWRIIEENAFALLVTNHWGENHFTHLPVFLERNGDEAFLLGHFARPNPHWEKVSAGDSHFIFSGPHGYISPSWYETREAVPTWNYVAVHARVTFEIIEDRESLVAILSRLTRKYEAPSGGWAYRPESALNQKLHLGIVGFRARVTGIEGKFKLSQNHPAQRRQRVMDQLSKSASTEDHRLAKEMARVHP